MIFKNLKLIFRKKKILLLFSALFFLILFIVFLFLALFQPWWKVWPTSIRSNIALNHLAISVFENPYCRSDCYLKRKIYYEEIQKSLGEEKFTNKIISIILDENENTSWRIELIKVLSSSSVELPAVILNRFQKYLDEDFGNIEVKENIFLNLGEQLNSTNYFSSLQSKLLDDSTPVSEKKNIIKNLTSLNYPLADFYFSLLLTGDNQDILIELLQALGADSSRFDLNREELFVFLASLLESDDYNFNVRRLALFILSDFWDEKRDPAVSVLFRRIIASEELDIFSKYFAIDIFNNYLDDKLPPLAIDPDSWDWYYQQE